VRGLEVTICDFKGKGDFMKETIPSEIIEQKIFIIRGHKVMFDKELAMLYGIGTRDLNKAVTRNLDRFPEDFMFQLNKKEFKNLMFQNGTSSWGGTRKMPRVFTEHGILMLSSVINTKRAIQVNIAIMRTFVKLRQFLSTHKELAHKLSELEKKIEKHDTEIQAIFEAIRQLMAPPPEPPRQRIGFHED
jgi:phage regulator Rha-like protein